MTHHTDHPNNAEKGKRISSNFMRPVKIVKIVKMHSSANLIFVPFDVLQTGIVT